MVRTLHIHCYGASLPGPTNQVLWHAKKKKREEEEEKKKNPYIFLILDLVRETISKYFLLFCALSFHLLVL